MVLLKELPCVSSLRSDKYTLKTIDKDHELCEYLNWRINTLYISGNYNDLYLKSDDVNLIWKIFSNIEELHCPMKELDY